MRLVSVCVLRLNWESNQPYIQPTRAVYSEEYKAYESVCRWSSRTRRKVPQLLVCRCVCISIHVYIYMYTHINIYVCICIHIYMSIYMCVYLHIYIYI